MALAILRLGIPSIGEVPAEARLGSNRYYSYSIGAREVRGEGMLPEIEDVVFESPVFGPLPSSAMGTTELTIPLERFDRDHRLVQLFTYRTKDGAGPAIGAPVRFPGNTRGPGSRDPGADSMTPPYGMSLARNEHSRALFLGDLIGAIRRVAPFVGQLFAAVSPASGSGGAGGAAPGAAAAPPSSEDLLRLLTSLFARAGGSGGVSQATALAEGARSQAAALPLAALMPLLSSVLTPDTVKALIGSLAPDKVIGAVTGGVKDIAKVGIENDKMFLDHLAKLNPGVNDPALDSLLASMSLSVSNDPMDIPYRRLAKVRLDFVDEASIRVRGTERVIYRIDSDLRIQLRLDTPRPIAHARMSVVVRDPATRAALAKARVAIDRAETGVLPTMITLRAADIAGIRPGDDVLVEATLTWRTKSGERVGTSISRLCIMALSHVFDRVEDTDEEIHLGDIVKHRDAWHRIWQATLPQGLSEADLECKYTVEVDRALTKTARGETQVRTEPKSEHRLAGRLQSGMRMSLTDLNRLLPTVSKYPSLPEPVLQALRVEEFTAPLRSAARFRARLHGRAGATLALWVFPILRVQRVVFLKLDAVDEGGRVRATTEELHPFAVPASIHFVGARSKR